MEIPEKKSKSKTPKEPFDPFSNKPDLTANSRKLYIHNLQKLNGGEPIKDLKFLSKTQEILAKLEEMKPNTRRTYLISIVSALKGRPEPRFVKLYNTYYAPLDGINKSTKDNTEKTPRVRENWLSQEEIVAKQEDLSRVITEIADKKKISAEQYERLLQLVVLSIYTLQPPRRNLDYINMVISRNPAETPELNYLDVATDQWIFNNYKTAKKYKQTKADIPDPLKDILAVYFKFHPQSKDIKKKKTDVAIPFLVHQDGTPLKTSTDMTRMLYKILGKKVGVSMLRSIYLTSKYGETLKDLKEDVSAMATSVPTAENNYIKQDWFVQIPRL